MTLAIVNGSCANKTGYKQIVISPEGEIRPVQSCVRTGLLHTRHTVQNALPGDYVYAVTWSSTIAEYHSSVVLADNTLLHHVTYRQWPESLPAEIREWLQPETGYNECYLPAGLGWDGRSSRADLSKLDRLKRFFYNLEDPIKDTLIESARKAPGRHVPTLWLEAQPLPLEFQLEPGNSDEWEAIIAWDHCGRLTVTKSTETTLVSITNQVRKAMHVVWHRGYVQWALFKI